MKLYTYPGKNLWQEITARPVSALEEIEQKVQPILQAVKSEGDQALRRFALEFDNIMLDTFEMPLKAISEEAEGISKELKEAIDIAYQNIKRFHEAQKKDIAPIETMPGVLCWRKQVAIEKVGIYIPGGTAPLFSTVLMLGVPAQLAGCSQVVLCSPSSHPAIRYAAALCGINRMYRVGGAQAVAAMAYGTHSVPKVSKLFGPGNQFVTTAKQLVSKEGIAIDMPAGPSEVAVYADNGANPAFIAADLLSQAEHGPDSQVLLVCHSEGLVQQVQLEIKKQLADLPRAAFAQVSLENSRAVVLEKEAEAIDLLNDYAAEHLILNCENAEEIASRITNAGSIFLGAFTPESCGDYASGTNHTLPTNGFARAYSGVSLDSFVKQITYQRISDEGLKNLGPAVITMAKNEALDGHAKAVDVRLQSLKS